MIVTLSIIDLLRNEFARNREVLDAAANHSGVAALLQADPKKQGKEKKPDANRVSLVFPGS